MPISNTPISKNHSVKRSMCKAGSWPSGTDEASRRPRRAEAGEARLIEAEDAARNGELETRRVGVARFFELLEDLRSKRRGRIDLGEGAEAENPGAQRGVGADGERHADAAIGQFLELLRRV